MKQMIGLAFVLAIFIGYNHSALAERPSVYDINRTATQGLKTSDSEITKNIQTLLKNDRMVSIERVTVEVTNGDVILRGKVNYKAEEIQMINMALSVKGVKEVHSMLVLSSPGQ